MLIMNNIYNFIEIGKRIKTERIRLGLNQQELADSLNLAARQTIAKWEKGTIMPQLQDMLNMCNLFRCELGYLLGEYTCRNRINTDISNETGLTEKSIQTLHDLKTKSSEQATDAFDTDISMSDIILHAINHLLSFESYPEDSLIGEIAQYLYGNFTHFYTQDICDREDMYYSIDDIRLWDEDHAIDGYINSRSLMDVMLLSIQYHLRKEREHLQFDSEPLKRLTPYNEYPIKTIDDYIAELKDEIDYLENLDENDYEDENDYD